jgi:hypothetical protein
MLFVKLEKAGGGWLWHNDRIDNKSELFPGCCLGELADRVKGRMGNIDGVVVPIALCDLLLWMKIVVKAGWSLAPSFSWIQGILGNLLCDGWCHCRGTYNTEA